MSKKWNLCSVNTYRSVHILPVNGYGEAKESEIESLDDYIAEAKRYVHRTNMNNGLTESEQIRHADILFVEVADAEGNITDWVYGGYDTKGQHYFYDRNDTKKRASTSELDGQIRFYVGERMSPTVRNEHSPVYVLDHHEKCVEDFTHFVIAGKDLAFIMPSL